MNPSAVSYETSSTSATLASAAWRLKEWVASADMARMVFWLTLLNVAVTGVLIIVGVYDFPPTGSQWVAIAIVFVILVGFVFETFEIPDDDGREGFLERHQRLRFLNLIRIVPLGAVALVVGAWIADAVGLAALGYVTGADVDIGKGLAGP